MWQSSKCFTCINYLTSITPWVGHCFQHLLSERGNQGRGRSGLPKVMCWQETDLGFKHKNPWAWPLCYMGSPSWEPLRKASISRTKAINIKVYFDNIFSLCIKNCRDSLLKLRFLGPSQTNWIKIGAGDSEIKTPRNTLWVTLPHLPLCLSLSLP